jgi:N-dimethylarginine dimethylaminohydrolase
MLRWQTVLGVVLGLLTASAILSLTGNTLKKRTESGPILSECDGRLRELVVHYEPSARPMVAAVYRDFLGALEADVTVHVVCPTAVAYEDFLSLAGTTKCRLSPIITHHPITTWSRDRWVALAPGSLKDPTTLWMPRGEAAEEIWPARAGDEQVGHDIASALGPAVFARRSHLYFDGGDFLADSKSVFVVPRVLQRNIQHTVRSRDEFLRTLTAELKRKVVLLTESPDHHAGMFMASVGNNTMLVGDPHLGKECVPAEFLSDTTSQGDYFMNLPGGPDFTPDTQRLFDAVASQCAAAGYQVVRIPTIPARDGRTYLTFLNALIESTGEKKIVYLPFYRGAEALNAAARKVWTDLGFEIRPVDCTDVFPNFGCLHCLVNILRRS